MSFPRVKGRRVEADFSGGNVTSDGGVLLLRQADRYLGLTASAARLFHDSRRQASCGHTVLSMIRQRVYGLAPGYEDLNDHDSLRQDLAWQTAVERDRPTASSPILCGLESRADWETAVAIHAGAGRAVHRLLCRAARSWDRERRMIARIEHAGKGSNPRYVVTNLPGNARKLYERVYCQRGEMENRIKEQMQLFSGRSPAHRWWPNQFRLLLSSLAYVLMESIRRLGLKGTGLARAQVGAIRLKLLKIGAVIGAQYTPAALPALKRPPLSAAVPARHPAPCAQLTPQGAVPGTGKTTGPWRSPAQNPQSGLPQPRDSKKTGIKQKTV